MTKWHVGGFRERPNEYKLAYTQIDVPAHTGKIRVFEPDSVAVASQIVREHNAFNEMLGALKKALPVLAWAKRHEHRGSTLAAEAYERAVAIVAKTDGASTASLLRKGGSRGNRRT